MIGNRPCVQLGGEKGRKQQFESSGETVTDTPEARHFVIIFRTGVPCLEGHLEH